MYIRTHIGMLQECKLPHTRPMLTIALRSQRGGEPTDAVPSRHRDRGATDTHIQLKPDLTSLKLQHDAIRIAQSRGPNASNHGSPDPHRRVSPDEIVRRAQIIGATHELGG